MSAGELTNNTGENLLVYGPKIGGSFDNSLYNLPPGRKTPRNWDCDGFYVPSDRVASQAVMSDRKGPVAVKYRDYRSPIITLSAIKYQCDFNEGIYSSGEIHWEIPNISYLDLPGSYPEVPGHVSAN